MNAAVFSIVPYERRQSHGWAAPADGYSADVGQASMQRALEQFGDAVLPRMREPA